MQACLQCRGTCPIAVLIWLLQLKTKGDHQAQSEGPARAFGTTAVLIAHVQGQAKAPTDAFWIFTIARCQQRAGVTRSKDAPWDPGRTPQKGHSRICILGIGKLEAVWLNDRRQLPHLLHGTPGMSSIVAAHLCMLSSIPCKQAGRAR